MCILTLKIINFDNPDPEHRKLIDMMHKRDDLSRSVGKFSLTQLDCIVYGEIERIIDGMFYKEENSI